MGALKGHIGIVKGLRGSLLRGSRSPGYTFFGVCCGGQSWRGGGGIVVEDLVE